MTAFVLRRLLRAVPLALAAVSLIFVLLELAPGDPEHFLLPPGTPAAVHDELRARWRLDDPLPVRYVALMGGVFAGELGHSVLEDRPVTSLIADALPHTLLLSAVALALTIALGTALGVAQAVQRGRLLDAAASTAGAVLYAMPSFWLAILLVLLFAHWLPVLPSSQLADPMADYLGPAARLLDRLRHLALPALALALANTAIVARQLRASMVEALGMPFVRAARARGFAERRVLLRHALPNALLPTLTLVALSLPFLVSGSVIVERVFAWPGMGTLIHRAILAQDTPLVMGCAVVYALLVAAGSLLADVLCAWVDPRVRLR